MDSCRAQIVRYYQSLPPGTLFTTRECLGMGLRDNVDQALARLVKEGLLIRIVRGMFVCAVTRKPQYSVEAITTLKASSFGKIIRQDGANAAHSIGVSKEKTKERSFIVYGSTSKFHICEGWQPVNLRTACAKKMRLEDNRAGTAVRALWHLGEKKITKTAVLKVLSYLNHDDCQLIVNSCAWMPYWLSNIFLIVFQNRFRKDSNPPQFSAA